MKIKKNDLVKVIAGKDIGKEGKVIQIFQTEKQIVVEGVNKSVKNLKPKTKDEKGKQIEYFAPIDVSNVELICPLCKKPTKVGYKIEGKNKNRICKKCKAVLN
ncbi:50S ribosomal protein L24 [Patescibacteria group bacterium]|nr:50S ribosomal protein L24 [Patescibacteria group bacterium]